MTRVFKMEVGAPDPERGGRIDGQVAMPGGAAVYGCYWREGGEPRLEDVAKTMLTSIGDYLEANGEPGVDVELWVGERRFTLTRS